MVLGKLPVPGRPACLDYEWGGGGGPPALAVGACGSCLGVFSLVCGFSFLSPSLWEAARCRLKYCLKGPLSPQQSIHQSPEQAHTYIQGITTKSCHLGR